MAIETLTIAALRLKTSNTADVYYTTDKDMQGSWYYDSTDTTSLDNTGTVLRSSNNMRFKRIFDGFANVKWFGAKGDGNTLDTGAIKLALAASASVMFPKGVYKVGNVADGPDPGTDPDPFVFPVTNLILFCEGARILVASGQSVYWSSSINASMDQWIFDCEDAPSNRFSSVTAPLDNPSPIPLRFNLLDSPAWVEKAKNILTYISVKWFGATGAGMSENLIDLNLTNNFDSISGSFVDDTKAIRFALTAMAASLEIKQPTSSCAGYGGPNTLYFPRGCYVHTQTLYVSAGMALKGDGASPVGGSVIFNMNPKNTQIVLQAKGFGGVGGGGSAHLMHDLILETRPCYTSNPDSYVIKFEDDVRNFDSRFRNIRFSNAPTDGAIFYVNEKYNRATPRVQPVGLEVTFHVYDSMIDVCEADFIRLGSYGQGPFGYIIVSSSTCGSQL